MPLSHPAIAVCDIASVTRSTYPATISSVMLIVMPPNDLFSRVWTRSPLCNTPGRPQAHSLCHAVGFHADRGRQLATMTTSMSPGPMELACVASRCALIARWRSPAKAKELRTPSQPCAPVVSLPTSSRAASVASFGFFLPTAPTL